MTQANAATVEVGVMKYQKGLFIPTIVVHTSDMGEADKLSEANGLSISLVKSGGNQLLYVIGIHQSYLVESREDITRFFEESPPQTETPRVSQFLIEVPPEEHEKFWPLFENIATCFVLVNTRSELRGSLFCADGSIVRSRYPLENDSGILN